MVADGFPREQADPHFTTGQLEAPERVLDCYITGRCITGGRGWASGVDWAAYVGSVGYLHWDDVVGVVVRWERKGAVGNVGKELQLLDAEGTTYMMNNTILYTFTRKD